MLVTCKFILIVFCLISLSWVIDGRSTELRKKRQTDPSEQPKRIVCYYAFWAAKRPGRFRFVPSNIDPSLCTHIMYSYARVEPNEGIVPYDSKVDIEERGWESMVELRAVNPEAKILLSIGGLFEGSSRFTKMAADSSLRSVFVRSASRTLRQYRFDGIDMSWLYPGFSEGSSAADKENYVNLMKELKEELNDEFIISISVPALTQYIESGFDVPELLKYSDYFNVLAYSYHDSTDATVNHHGPLYSLPDDPGNKDANVDATIREYLRRGAKPQQLNLVIPLYGVAFVLEDPLQNDIGAPTEDEGIGLEEPGALIYFELCQRVRKESWTVKKVNRTAMGPYAYKDRLWVAYDDEEMVRNKAKYALEMGLGGLSFWTVDQDDFRGMCHINNFPLLRAAREVVLQLDGSEQLSQNEIQANTQRNDEESPSSTTIRPTRSTISTSITTPTTTRRPASQKTTARTQKDQRPSSSWSSMDGDLFMKPDKISEGTTIYRSNRDIVFSDFKIWIENHF